MRKIFLSIIILIVFLILVGCGQSTDKVQAVNNFNKNEYKLGETMIGRVQRVDKAQAFNNFFKAEHDIGETFIENIKPTFEKIQSSQNLNEAIQQLSILADKVKGCTNDISNIETPKELEKYKQYELAQLNQLIVLLNQTQMALRNKNLNTFTEAMNKLNDLKNGNKLDLNTNSEYDRLILDAAKEAGLEATRKHDKNDYTYIFK